MSSSRLRVGAFVTPGDAVTLTQGDSTTCGATVVLAARLLLGTAGAPGDSVSDPTGLSGPTGPLPGLRLKRALHAEQRRLQARMNRRSGGPLGPLPWTRRLGSTPWAVARALGEDLDAGVPVGSVGSAGAAYRVRWVREGGPGWADDVARMRRALDAGLPAAVLVGGPLVRPRPDGAGPVRALCRAVAGPAALALPPVPRHYVLALPWRLAGQDDPGPGRVHLYEPSSGSVRVLDLLAPRDPAAPGPRELCLLYTSPSPRD